MKKFSLNEAREGFLKNVDFKGIQHGTKFCSECAKTGTFKILYKHRCPKHVNSRPSVFYFPEPPEYVEGKRKVFVCGTRVIEDRLKRIDEILNSKPSYAGDKNAKKVMTAFLPKVTAQRIVGKMGKTFVKGVNNDYDEEKSSEENLECSPFFKYYFADLNL